MENLLRFHRLCYPTNNRSVPLISTFSSFKKMRRKDACSRTDSSSHRYEKYFASAEIPIRDQMFKDEQCALWKNYII